MEKVVITPDSGRRGLKALVDESGEGFVYAGPDRKCVYVPEGVGSCMVGQFLANEGVSVDRLAQADEGMLPAAKLLHALEVEGLVTVEGDALWALQSAQACQDDLKEWGEAYKQAMDTL